jgi:uncharacterized protein
MREYLHKLFSLIPLSALAAGVITAFITGLWWISLLGLAAAAIISFQRVAAELDTAGPLTEEPSQPDYDLTRINVRMRSRFRALVEKKDQILAALGDVTNTVALEAEQTAVRVKSLVGAYYELLVKLERIRPFITREAINSTKASIKDLAGQVENCADEVTRENLAMALKNEKDELDRLLDLQKHKKRIESQLVNVVSALNSVHVRIVGLSISPEDYASSSGEIADRIDELLSEVEISEKVNREIQHVLQAGR